MKFGSNLRSGLVKNVSSRLAGAARGVGKRFIDPDSLSSPPPAPSNMVFFPLAIRHVGRLEDGIWQDWETNTLYFPSPVSPSGLTVEDIIEQYRPPTKPVNFPISTLDNRSSERRDITAELAEYERLKDEWDAAAPERLSAAQKAVADDQEYVEDWNAGVARHSEGVAAIRAAYEKLMQAILDEKIAIYFRPKSGGVLKQLAPSIVTETEFSEPAIRHGTYSGFHLFVDREALEATFRKQPSLPEVQGVNVEELSDYLQLALYIHSQGFGPTFKGEKKDVRKALKAAEAKFGVALSVQQEEYLATFLRNTDAQGGKNPKFSG